MEDLADKLRGSLLFFTQFFFEIRYRREFIIPQPSGQKNHFHQMSLVLSKTARLEIDRLIINLPPRFGKSEFIKHYVAWCFARNPGSEFLYISYAQGIADDQAGEIRDIMSLPEYKNLFGIHIDKKSSAKKYFKTNFGGVVKASGPEGAITGYGAGWLDKDVFAGSIIIDDIHKADDVYSEVHRGKIARWYLNTVSTRSNSVTTPIIYIGHRLHEDDFISKIESGYDGKKWTVLKLKALNDQNQSLYPEKLPTSELLNMKEHQPYDFWAQYQQEPQPAGGALFKPEWFKRLDKEPEIIATFITGDTAETDKNYNDATVFSFWGLYKIKHKEMDIGQYAIHWLDCMEVWVEPCDLEEAFMDFYTCCLRHKVKPQLVGIEKKSTGSTLLSLLKKMQGVRLIDTAKLRYEVAGTIKSKERRFLDSQPYISRGQVSIPNKQKHTDHVIEHMRKITANDTHRYDDIADTCADAILMAFMDNSLVKSYNGQN